MSPNLTMEEEATTSNVANKRILVTGGNGFIGSHVARELRKHGSTVRIVDVAPTSAFPEPICDEFIQGNLCDGSIAKRAVIDVDIVLHFAANMGGMGAIHEANERRIYSDNHTMTMNILSASIDAGVKLFLYASSACVYPTQLQGTFEDDISLREDHAWNGCFPRPQGLYGLEKLVSEMLVKHAPPSLEVRVARFHNVYGPFGAWGNGREKAPAAMLRKAVSLKYLLDLPIDSSALRFEIWGDGKQRRSFLFIDDAVDAVIKLLNSDCSLPVNIGSPISISIKSLAELALSIAPVDKAIPFSYVNNAPLGVASRNSNNDFAEGTLQWSPQTSLRDGMVKTGKWIQSEIDRLLVGCEDRERAQVLNGLSRSQLLNLDNNDTTFAILLPITSRASPSPEDCLTNLTRFASSLYDTTWRDTHFLGATRYRIKVYLGVDHDDHFLLPSSKQPSRAEQILTANGITDVTTVLCKFPRGHVCSIWRTCAKTAWEAGCDFFVLMGDDVVLKDEGWIRTVDAKFQDLAAQNCTPFGFGCVAFTDISFPGMPTFPVVHKTHMIIFDGTVVPPLFINQDGDPFLFQLYRRWGCSVMVEHRLTNGIGGADIARYDKILAHGWTFKPLTDAVSAARQWLESNSSSANLIEKMTLDIVIPCYRVNLPILRKLLDLKPSYTATTMFIIIIDNPDSPNIAQLEKEYAHRPDIRIRINKNNLGASESRNRGMKESAADWIHFLDDDVVADPNLLIEAETIIRKHPNAAGFVGSTCFPPATSIFTTAVHLAGVTHFWNIASNPAFADDVPWGVTANLIARRIDDGILYDPVYPKTGGGEDIDFCRKKREYFLSNIEGGEGFIAAPMVKAVHPWWNGGQRSYQRFYMWAYGDGALISRFAPYTYQDRVPNSAEMLCGALVLAASSFLECRTSAGFFFMKTFLSVLVANILFDANQHLFRHPERTRNIDSTIQGWRWMLAVMESSLIRMATEMGRIHGLVGRGEWQIIGMRFDWFAGRLPGAIREEKMNNTLRLLVALLILSMVA